VDIIDENAGFELLVFYLFAHTLNFGDELLVLLNQNDSHGDIISDCVVVGV
jgi:hypothetical protein